MMLKLCAGNSGCCMVGRYEVLILKPLSLYGSPTMAVHSFPAASARAAGRSVFGEGDVINFYDNVNCTGAESSLNDCQPPYTLSSQNCGYAGVFCQSKHFGSTYFWFGRLVVVLLLMLTCSLIL